MHPPPNIHRGVFSNLSHFWMHQPWIVMATVGTPWCAGAYFNSGTSVVGISKTGSRNHTLRPGGVDGRGGARHVGDVGAAHGTHGSTHPGPGRREGVRHRGGEVCSVCRWQG